MKSGLYIRVSTLNQVDRDSLKNQEERLKDYAKLKGFELYKTYKDAPFQTCTKEMYKEKMDYIEKNYVDLSEIFEEDDNTKQADNLACAGGNCEII